MISRFLSIKIGSSVTATLLGLLLLFPVGSREPVHTFSSVAEAGFFSSDLELFEEVVKLGGTLSGEHGIGHVQKPFMDLAFDKKSLNVMSEIKKVFDPNGILNPGKIL